MDELILTPNELDRYISSIPSMIENMAVRTMREVKCNETDLSDYHVTARNAEGEEEAEVLSAVLDEEDNTIRLILDTVTDCNHGYISDQDTETASTIYNAFWWSLPERPQLTTSDLLPKYC